MRWPFMCAFNAEVEDADGVCLDCSALCQLSRVQGIAFALSLTLDTASMAMLNRWLPKWVSCGHFELVVPRMLGHWTDGTYVRTCVAFGPQSKYATSGEQLSARRGLLPRYRPK